MSKQVVLEMWVSIIPDKMYDSWIKRGFIKRGAYDLVECEGKYCNQFCDVLSKDNVRKISFSAEDTRILQKESWRKVYHRFNVSHANMEIIRKEVGEWYKDVFLFVEKWLEKHKFIDLKKGSFRGGFCAVEQEDETTRGWGAPLAGPRNKVVQIKEKFGRIVVYFGNINKIERAKINRFAKYCERKFDCCADFF